MIKLATDFLKRYQIRSLTQQDLATIIKLPGIGRTKAARILAIKEIGERTFSNNFITTKIVTTQDVINQVKDIITKKQEHFICLYLNARQELIQKEIIAIGNLNQVIIEAKEIFKPAILTPCKSIILVHNHPSGDPTPTLEDLDLTQKIKRAGKLLGIEITDHIIITSSSYFSFSDI